MPASTSGEFSINRRTDDKSAMEPEQSALRHRRVTAAGVVVAALCQLSLVSCADAKPWPAGYKPEPWNLIARAKNPRVLLINVDQSVANPHSACYQHYRTKVVSETPRVIRIFLLRPPPSQGFSCTDQAAKGPFYTRVWLKRPYRAQKLYDAYDGRRHPLVPRRDFT